MVGKDTKLWIAQGFVLLVGAAVLAWLFAWVRDYAATMAGDIDWICGVGECGTDDPRSMIPIGAWAIVVVVAVGWLFLPGAGFFSGIAFMVLAAAFASGHAAAVADDLATDGTRVQGIVAACIGAVLMVLGVVLTIVLVTRQRRRRRNETHA